MASDRRPVIRGPESAWQRLGELLQLRRAELGYQRRPAFTRERGINIRLVTDIENAYRPNTFLTPTLREVARAYAVTYDSVVAVILEHDNELIPAEPASPLATVVQLPPMTDPSRIAANLPYYKKINERRIALAAQGITDPTGAQMFGRGTKDAQDWDGRVGQRLSIDDRAWFIAELQRWEAARDGRDGAGTDEPGVTPR